jgi:hypothetical protein
MKIGKCKGKGRFPWAVHSMTVDALSSYHPTAQFLISAEDSVQRLFGPHGNPMKSAHILVLIYVLYQCPVMLSPITFFFLSLYSMAFINN